MTAEPVTIPGGARRARRVTRRGHPVTPPGSPLFGRLGAILERVAAIAGRLEAIFGPSWGPRGPSRSHLRGQISASRLQKIIAFCIHFLYLYFLLIFFHILRTELHRMCYHGYLDAIVAPVGAIRGQSLAVWRVTPGHPVTRGHFR